MPLYEYKCQSCGETFEVIQKFSDEPLKTHPNCGGEVERLISRSALKFKGSGWYVTDYASSSSGNGRKESEKKDSGSKETAKDSKADKSSSESAAKPEPKPSTTTSSKPEKKS